MSLCFCIGVSLKNVMASEQYTRRLNGNWDKVMVGYIYIYIYIYIDIKNVNICAICGKKCETIRL